MSILKTMLENNIEEDIRYVLFNAYLLITGVLGFVFGGINAFNQRPMENIITGIVIGIIGFLMYYLSTKSDQYILMRRLYLFFMTFVYLPFGYWSSPGSSSAILYMELLVIFIMTFVVVSKWEYIFPSSGIVIILVMLQTEIWFPENYLPYTDKSVRIFDISINYTIVVLSVMFTIVYVVKQYNRHNDMLYKISITDALTGLYNRRYVNNFIEMEFNRSSRTKQAFSMVFIDLNNFKQINDSYGHTVGDQVLIEVADIIMNNIRNYDIAARYGGDEFMIILPETNEIQALKNMDRLNEQFNAYALKYADTTFSVGFGVCDSSDKTLDEMFKIADQALYEKKSMQKDKKNR